MFQKLKAKCDKDACKQAYAYQDTSGAWLYWYLVWSASQPAPRSVSVPPLASSGWTRTERAPEEEEIEATEEMVEDDLYREMNGYAAFASSVPEMG